MMSQKIILQLWEERPRFQQFELPVDSFEDIKSWVHEFTELSIWNILHSFGFHKKILNLRGFEIVLPNGEKQIHKPAHVLAAIHTVSIVRPKAARRGVLCHPSEYFKLLMKVDK